MYTGGEAPAKFGAIDRHSGLCRHARTVLGTSELLLEISAHIQESNGTLRSFILVNHLFFSAGIRYFWRCQHSLVPLLKILLPPDRLDILDQPAVLDRLKWDTFGSYASHMRHLILILDCNVLKGYDNKLFKIISNRKPNCLSHLTSVTITLTSNSMETASRLNLVFKLIAKSPLATIELKDVTWKTTTLVPLKPFQHSQVLRELTIQRYPSGSRFWEILLPSWQQLTMVEFGHTGDEIDNSDMLLTALSTLPRLREVRLKGIQRSNSQTAYFFPSLETLHVEFWAGPTNFIHNINAPYLSHIWFIIWEPSNEPTYFNLFTTIANRNHTSLVSLVIEMERDLDTSSEVPEELRGEAFNENTLSPLYVFSSLKCLHIHPGLSCHLLTDAFYATLPSHWPELMEFHLGREFFFPTPHPVATLQGIVAFLDSAQYMQDLCVPHVRGETLPSTDKTYPALKDIGRLFGDFETFKSYVDWTSICFPGICYVEISYSIWGIEKHQNLLWDSKVSFHSPEPWIEYGEEE